MIDTRRLDLDRINTVKRLNATIRAAFREAPLQRRIRRIYQINHLHLLGDGVKGTLYQKHLERRGIPSSVVLIFQTPAQCSYGYTCGNTNTRAKKEI